MNNLALIVMAVSCHRCNRIYKKRAATRHNPFGVAVIGQAAANLSQAPKKCNDGSVAARARALIQLHSGPNQGQAKGEYASLSGIISYAQKLWITLGVTFVAHCSIKRLRGLVKI
jgi:hypothetical protein